MQCLMNMYVWAVLVGDVNTRLCGRGRRNVLNRLQGCETCQSNEMVGYAGEQCMQCPRRMELSLEAKSVGDVSSTGRCLDCADGILT